MKNFFSFLIMIVIDSSVSQSQSVAWKSFFTLAPDEGTQFTIDTVAIIPGGGVPVINITNAGAIILTSAGGAQLTVFEVRDNGKTYVPLPGNIQRGPDGGFVYLPDGSTRFLSEEPAPGSTPQRRKSRIVSWISSDGRNWIREAGIRYQPGVEDDSISSVPSVIQVRDSLWRMYFVGDFYRTNGTRTSISSDWGVTWQQESRNNILRRGDVDPHPVYLTNGKVRLYFRTGFNSPNPSERGVGYCDSDDGLHFDSLQTRLIIPDTAAPRLNKLDPAVIRFPNGEVACYVGAAPGPGSPDQGNAKLIVAWGKKITNAESGDSPEKPSSIQLFQNYPNPFNPTTTISFRIPKFEFVNLKIFDVLAREVTTLVSNELGPGVHSVVFPAEGGSLPDRWQAGASGGVARGLASGVYFYRLSAGGSVEVKKMLIAK